MEQSSEKIGLREFSMEELMKPSKWEWWEYPEIFWLRYVVRPYEDIIFYTKRFFQRGINGYASSDVWGMHAHLTEIILKMAKDLKKNKHGIPAVKNEAGEWVYEEERWDKILDEIIAGFEVLYKCDDGQIEWGGFEQMPGEDFKAKMEETMKKKWPEWRYTTKEEEDKVTRAFHLLWLHWFNLWD